MTDWNFSNLWPKDNRERVAIVGVCSALLFVFGGDAWRAVVRGRDNLRDSVRENMPLEAEINRAKQLAASLVPDLRRNHEVIVREQVEVEELRADIRKSRTELKQQRDQLFERRAKLSSANSSTESQKSESTIRHELRERFSVYQSLEATVAAKEQTLQYREESLAKAQSAQREMFGKKQELEAQVVQFAARLKAIERNGVESHIVVDRDKVANCEELLRYLRKRLTIAERVSEFPEVDVTEVRPTGRDVQDERIESEIDSHFQRQQN